MHTFLDYTKKTPKMEQTLEELKGLGMLAKYEFREGAKQVRIEVHNERNIVYVSVILGYIPEIGELIIENFKKFRCQNTSPK